MERSTADSFGGHQNDKSDEAVCIAAHQTQRMDKHPRDNISSWRWILTAIGLYLSSLLFGLDTTIAADVQVSVYETFQDMTVLPWVGIGFPMAAGAAVMLFGRLFGLFNVKHLTLASIALFEIGSALCGAAPGGNALIVGRVIAGMGGSGMYLGGLTYINLYTRGKEIPIYTALMGLCWGTGAILGPVVGGGFSVSKATWRWAFYINLPLAGLLTPAYLFAFPTHNPRPDLSLRQKLSEIDWVGAFLFFPLVVLFMTAVSFAGSKFEWDSTALISIWVVWGVCTLAFVIQQAFCIFTTPERRIFPCHFIKSRTLTLLFCGTAAAGAANATPLYYIPLLFQFTQGDSALRAAVRLLPYICVFVAFIMVTGGLLPVVGRYNLFYVVGGVFTIIGSVLMFRADTDATAASIYGYEVLLAAGAGSTLMTGYAVAVASVSRPSDIAKATGFINVAQIGGIAMTLSICTCLYENLGYASLKNELSPYALPDNLVRSALTGTFSPVFTEIHDSVITDKITGIVVHTMGRVYGTTIAAGVVLCVSGILMSWEKLEIGLVAAG